MACCERGDGDPGGDDECERGSVGAAAGERAGGWDEEVFKAKGDESVVVKRSLGNFSPSVCSRIPDESFAHTAGGLEAAPHDFGV